MFLVPAPSSFAIQKASSQKAPPQNFRIRHDRNVSKSDVRAMDKLLESQYAGLRKRLNLSFHNKADVIVCNTLNRFRAESHSYVFDDAAYRDGKIYICLETFSSKPQDMQSAITRTTARALLDEVPGCPRWYAECYSISQSGEFTRFGQPARLTVSSFSDLSEDYTHFERAEDAREVYAKLGYTAHFLIDRYGEKKIDLLFPHFQRGESYEEAFESVFGEKIGVIEQAWVASLHTPLQK